MCNAWNHSNNCDCGFGPPYAVCGTFEILKEENWIDSVVSCKGRLIKGMREVGFGPEEINEALTEYQKIPKEQQGLSGWFQNILNRRQYFDISSKVELETIPLFRLHLPAINGRKIPGCRIIYEESNEEKRQQKWSFRIIGKGMGKTRLVGVYCSSKVIAENGKCKIIFVKIPIRVTEVKVVQGDRPITTFLRTEIDASASNISFHNGAMTCQEKLCNKDGNSLASPSDLYPLATSEKDYIGFYTKAWSYTSGMEMKLGIKAFSSESVMELYIYRDKMLEFHFELSGGYDYLLMPLVNDNGIKWKLSKKGFQRPDDLMAHT